MNSPPGAEPKDAGGVRPHVVIPAVIAIPGALILAVALGLRGSPPPAPPPPPVNALVRPTPAASTFSWRLTAAMSAHRAMVLEVETTRPGEAVAIARQLTEPYEDRFDEVLVFFFEPDASPRRAVLRVQWTRSHGYKTLILRSPR